MNIRNPLLSTLVVALTYALSACAEAPNDTVASSPSLATPAAQTATQSESLSESMLPVMMVNKSPSCGCCGLWVAHMEDAGFKVEINDTDDMGPIKERLGVPYDKGSCHTAEVGGYFIEGHVPADDIKRLLAERPEAKGLTVPGMPAGSPGMELPDGHTQPYDVELVATDGTTTVFSHHGN